MSDDHDARHRLNEKIVEHVSEHRAPKLRVTEEDICLPAPTHTDFHLMRGMPAPRTSSASGSNEYQPMMSPAVRNFYNNATTSILTLLAVGVCLLFSVILALSLAAMLGHDGGANNISQMSDSLYSYFTKDLGMKNVCRLDQVLGLLPVAAIACVATTSVVGYVSSKSRSRKIDWTPSRLLLEHTGSMSLAVKWSAIQSVEQAYQWELFHGRQPIFKVTTKHGKVFHLRLSDVTQKHNIGEFFSLIKTNSPDVELTVSKEFANDNSYTELWLKYFSTPAEREKTGLLEPGMLLDNDRYRVERTISGGGQGTAYLANVEPGSTPKLKDDGSAAVEQVMTAKTEELAAIKQVVLKEYVLPIHRGQLTAERTTDKLKNEAAILEKLDHPQIVKLLDAFVEDYRGYLALEFVEGEPLKDVVARMGPLPEEMVVELAMQICSILNYLHTQSPPVVHRDITPDNLMLQENGEIKLVDFNVACQVDSSATATVVGKHAYIPPEQFRGKASPKSDIYALGGSMYFLLTGQEPEPITTSHPIGVNPKISSELDAIVAKATHMTAKDRFESAEELMEALRPLLLKSGQAAPDKLYT